MASRKKRVKKVTIAELQSYVQGAIDLNDEDWHPDKTQWEKIVDMLMNVKVDPPKVERIVEQTPVQQPDYAQQGPNANADSALTGESLDGNTKRPRQLDLREGKGYEIKHDGTFEKQGDVLKSGIKVKTPTIDTSVDDYDSPFG
jgi:hypothetical protein